MKKKAFLYAFLSVAFLVATAEVLNSTGQAGYTGSPNEQTCVACHSGAAVNSGGGSITITSNIPSNQYLLDHTYQVTVTVSQTGISLFGFGMEALIDANKNNGGTLIVTNATETQILSKTIGGVSRKNIVHKKNGGAGTDTKSFTFNWKSPATNVGNITFYAVGNAANANNSSAGDFIYSTSQAVTPDPILGVEQNENIADVRVFPNPATECILVHFNQAQAGRTSANLYNLNGSFAYTLFDEQADAGPFEKKVDLDPSLSKGIYLLELNSNGRVSFQKVLIR